MDALERPLGLPVSDLARSLEMLRQRNWFLPWALPLVVLSRGAGWAGLDRRVTQNQAILENGVGGPWAGPGPS